MYGLFYGVFLLLILSFCRVRDGETDGLSREATTELKGIAILMVLLGHMTYMKGFITMPVTPALGAPAVDIFLFLSSFGLMYSYSHKGLQGFISRRLAVIMVPFILVTCLKAPLMYLWMKMPISLIALNFTALNVEGDTTMWYIQYILLCYLVFFIVFKIPKLTVRSKVVILCIIGAALAIGNGYLYYSEQMIQHPLVESYSHHLSFPLGALCYLWLNQYRKLSVRTLTVVSVVSFIIFQFVAFPGIDGYAKYYLNNLCYVIFFVAVFGILKHYRLHSKLLSWLGELAYPMYLNEFFVILLVSAWLPIAPGLQAACVLLVSILIAIPTKWVSDRILTRIQR